MKLRMLLVICILLIGGCASHELKHFGYDVLSNYQCSQGENCLNNHINRIHYQSQCMGGVGLPDCDQTPLNYDEFMEQRKEALEGIRNNK